MNRFEVLIDMAITCYVATLFGYTVALFLKQQKKRLELVGNFCLGLGFLGILIFLIQRAIKGSQPPWVHPYDAFVCLSASVVLWYGLLARKIGVVGFKIAVVLFSCFFLGYAQWFDTGFYPLPPIQESSWFFIHQGVGLLSYAAFAVSCIAGLYRLEVLSHKAMAIGFLLLTIAIMAGVIWVYQGLGNLWGWHPNEIWILLAWSLYAGYLYLAVRGKGKLGRVRWVSLAGCVLLLR